VNPYVSLLIGVACAGVGGELFVRGLVGVARWARVSSGMIGATVAAFATSSPELSVAIGSAGAGHPEISLGDTLGSNVVNVALILGLALCISGIYSPRTSVRRDFPVALLVPVALGALGVDGRLSRIDEFILIVLFLLWLSVMIKEARRERSAAASTLGEMRHARAAIESVGGLVLLIGSGHFIVIGARGIALAFGVPEFIIGATVVAVGTSVPELATTIISKVRGHEEIGLGTVLGSNIFNGLFIVGVAASICPIHVSRNEAFVALGFGFVTTLLTLPRADGLIERWRGWILIGLYILYLVAVLRS
jgi:cation:H+ antiporter